MIDDEQDRMSHIRATNFFQPDDPTVLSAERFAAAIVTQLNGGEDGVSLDFSGMRGVASSYFNVLFGDIISAVGAQVFEQRVKLYFETPTQKLVANRSREAVLKAG